MELGNWAAAQSLRQQLVQQESRQVTATRLGCQLPGSAGQRAGRHVTVAGGRPECQCYKFENLSCCQVRRRSCQWVALSQQLLQLVAPRSSHKEGKLREEYQACPILKDFTASVRKSQLYLGRRVCKVG